MGPQGPQGEPGPAGENTVDQEARLVAIEAKATAEAARTDATELRLLVLENSTAIADLGTRLTAEIALNVEKTAQLEARLDALAAGG